MTDKKTFIRKKFRVTYCRYGVSQEMGLVSQADYEQIYKPTVARTRELVEETAGLNRKRDADQIRENQETIRLLYAVLDEEFGKSFFTTGSPLGLAMETGVMVLPASQGGSSEVVFEEIH